MTEYVTARRTDTVRENTQQNQHKKQGSKGYGSLFNETISGFEFWSYWIGWVILNLFLPNVPSIYPLKTSGSQRFSDIFRDHRNERLS